MRNGGGRGRCRTLAVGRSRHSCAAGRIHLRSRVLGQGAQAWCEKQLRMLITVVFTAHLQC